MTVMTPAGFAKVTERIWTGVRENFARDHRLTAAIIGYTATGEQVVLVSHPAAAYDAPHVRARTRQEGYHPIRGGFEDNIAEIRSVFADHAVVAAIRVSEAWYARDDVAADVLAEGILPREHPMADEIAMVIGLWPQERFMLFYRADIIRDDRGQNPVLRPDRVLSGEEHNIEGWLAAILPQPPA